jgi:uncharacterized membrane protein
VPAEGLEDVAPPAPAAHPKPERRAEFVARLDPWVPWIGTAVLFAALYALALARYSALDGSYDLGYFGQAAWLITHGRPVFVTVRGLYLLGDHASPIFWPIAWLTALVPRIPTLLAVQSLALALGVVPLYAICRRLAGLRVLPSASILVAYGLFPALNNVNLADFHPEAVAVPALLGASYFGLTRRWVPYGACLAVVLLSREDLCLTAAFLGLLLVIEGSRRAGLITMAVAAAWLAVDLNLIMPHFAGSFVQTSFLDRYGSGPGEIVGFLVTHPWRVVVDLLTAQNAEFFWLMLAPVIFLPLVAPKYLMPTIPLQVLYLLTSRPAAHTIEGQYSVSTIAFVFLATAMALGSFREGGPEWRALVPLVAAACFFNTSFAAGGLAKKPWDWERTPTDRAMAAAAKRIPKDAAVAGSVGTWQLLTGRSNLYYFPAPWDQYDRYARNDPVPLAERRRDTDWILVNTADAVQWSPDRVEALARLAPALGFRKVFDRDGVQLYRR